MSYTIQVGDRFYDDLEGRYITVKKIGSGQITAYCEVLELDMDTTKPDPYHQHFNISDLLQYQYMGDGK